MDITQNKLGGFSTIVTRGLLVFVALLLAIAATFLHPSQVLAAQTLTEYDIPTAGSDPMAIVVGPDGASWFVEYNTSKIGKITTAGVITEYPLADGASPRDITAGPDGALWFTMTGLHKIGRITTDGVITEFNLPQGQPMNLTTGPDGNIWFTYWTGYIGKITPEGVTTEYNIRTGWYNPMARDITTGPDGALWFTEQVGRIGRITTTGTVTHYAIAQSDITTPYSITTGPDGAVWWGNMSGYIGRITTAGVTSAYYAEGIGSQISDITTGLDGHLWFTSSNNKLGRITTTGVATLYPVTPQSSPYGITVGSDGALWFTEWGGNRIGRFTITPTAAPTNLSAASPTKNAPSLSWDAVTGATSYNVYRDGVIVGSSGTPTFTDSTLSEGSYDYQVSAVDANGESALTSAVTVIVDKTRPAITFTSPASFGQVFTEGPLVTVQAADANGLSSMSIHVYSSANVLLTTCGSATPAELTAGTMSCNLSSLPNGTYYIKAGTFDKAGNNKTINSGTFIISS